MCMGRKNQGLYFDHKLCHNLFMGESAVFKENSEGKLITYKKDLLTDPVYNLGTVNKTSLSLELAKGEKKENIDLISFIEKEPKLKLWKATEKEIEYWRERFGDNGVEKSTNQGKAAEVLFQREIDNILLLNQKGNINVPKITDSRENYYKMTFIRGISGEKSARLELSRDTKLLIVKKTLEAVKSVFNDGIVDMEYMPKNSIIVPNLKTGIPESVVLIDFGVSFQIDKDGKIEVDMDLFNESAIRIDADNSGAGIFPPELNGKKGVVKIDAEKALVWTLSQRVISGWLFDVNVAGAKEFMAKATSQNPDNRWSLDEFISYFNKIEIDESKVGSCVPEEKLNANKQMIGRPDNEVSIDEKQVNRIVEELTKLRSPAS